MSLQPHPQTLHRITTVAGEVYYILADSLAEAAIRVEEFLQENPSHEGGCEGDEIYAIKTLGGDLLVETGDDDDGDEDEVIPVVENSVKTTDAARTKN